MQKKTQGYGHTSDKPITNNSQNVGGENTGGGEGRTEGARVWTHSTTSVTEELCVAPPSDVYRKVGRGPSRLGVGGRWDRGCPRQAPNDGEALPRRHGIDRGLGR